MAQSFKWFSATDLGEGVSTTANPPGPLGKPLKGEYSQASRALGLAAYFVSGSTAINLSQALGTPLYLFNKEWYNSWIAFTKQSWGLLTMTMTQWWAPTIIRVSGDASMRGQLIKTADGGLVCDFPERMVLMANHQIYTDWLYLWWIGYTAGMHGRICVVLKESLKRIPVIGWGMQFAQFIFLKRNWQQDKPSLKAHMQRLIRPNDPMWLMIFPEGTNLANCTRETSRKWALKNGIMDMKHTLVPRSTGLQFILQELRGTVDYIYDCTIAYEGVPHGAYAQDIFTVGASYFGGRPPKSVNMFWRRFRIRSIPLDDPQKFDLWLRRRWREKDKFIDQYLQKGKFPADRGSNQNFTGRWLHGAGHIEAEIKPRYWHEFLQVFAPIGVLALVLYLFYGILPHAITRNVRSVDQKTVMKQLQDIQDGKLRVPETKDIIGVPPKQLQDKITALKTLALDRDPSSERAIAELKKSIPAGSLPAGNAGPKPKPNIVNTRKAGHLRRVSPQTAKNTAIAPTTKVTSKPQSTTKPQKLPPRKINGPLKPATKPQQKPAPVPVATRRPPKLPAKSFKRTSKPPKLGSARAKGQVTAPSTTLTRTSKGSWSQVTDTTNDCL